MALAVTCVVGWNGCRTSNRLTLAIGCSPDSSIAPLHQPCIRERSNPDSHLEMVEVGQLMPKKRQVGGESD